MMKKLRAHLFSEVCVKDWWESVTSRKMCWGKAARSASLLGGVRWKIKCSHQRMSGGTSCTLSPIRWTVWSGYSAEISASFSVIINCSWGRSARSDSLSIRSTTVETSSHLISGLPSQARLFCFSFFFFFWNQFSMVDFSKLIRLSLGTSALRLHNYHSSAFIPLSERNTFILRLAVIIVVTHHQGRANRNALYTHVLVYLDVSHMHNLNGN